MLWLVQAGSVEEAQALRLSPATAQDLADAAQLPARLGAARLHRRRLLRAWVATSLGVAAPSIKIERLASGGQHILEPTPLFASLAARGDWLALVLAQHSIGVDIETRPAEQPLPIDLLHPHEQAALMRLTPAHRSLAFLRFWTAREAYCKATGRGLPMDLSQIEARDDLEGRGVLVIESGVVRAKAAITLADQYLTAVVELRAPD